VTTPRWRVVKVVVALLGLGLLILPLISADARFISRAAYEEARILLKRRSLDRLIADSSTPAARRDAFALVRDARRFATDSLGLNAGGRFSSYADVGHDTLVLVISASPRDALTEYQWRYPIVGSVPYKGFFDFGAAAAEARALEAQGYDTYTRPAPAFSTLGWFDDPLLSTAMTRDKVSLVSMVLHELTHSTWYVPSQTPFDESLAEFAGWRGAECFFRARHDSAAAARAAAIWRDERKLGAFYERLSARLDSVYARREGGMALQFGRDSAFASARAELATKTFDVYNGVAMSKAPLNNAAVVAQRIYGTHLGVFDRVLQLQGGRLRSTLEAMGRAIKTDDGRRDPFVAVAALDAEAQGPGCIR